MMTESEKAIFEFGKLKQISELLDDLIFDLGKYLSVWQKLIENEHDDLAIDAYLMANSLATRNEAQEKVETYKNRYYFDTGKIREKE